VAVAAASGFNGQRYAKVTAYGSQFWIRRNAKRLHATDCRL